jgi:putative Mg2+ transporter-C (MgtC) family protein
MSPLELEILGEVVLAMVLGAVLGLEREFAGKPAGIRTHMLVAGAAALLVGLGFTLVERSIVETGQQVIAADPIRIVQAIIIGVSFLGTGTIFRAEHDDTVQGLTTAASLLMASGIGVSVALRQFGLAVAITLAVAIVLGVLGRIEDGIRRRRQPQR